MESNRKLRMMMMKRTKKHHSCCWPLNRSSHLNSCTSTSSSRKRSSSNSRSWTQRNWKQRNWTLKTLWSLHQLALPLLKGQRRWRWRRDLLMWEKGRNLRGSFKMDVVSVSATYSSVRNIWGEWDGICRSWVKTNLKWQWWVSSSLPLVIMTGKGASQTTGMGRYNHF